MNSLEKHLEKELELEIEKKLKKEKSMNSLKKLLEITKTFNKELELEEQKDEEKNGRKGMPVYSGVLTYFPDALKEVAKCSLAGQKQHNQGDKLYWDKNKSFDNEDALVRHLIDHSKNPIDEDGILHLAKVAWRALASLQIYLENR
jgi:hypothetical protein